MSNAEQDAMTKAKSLSKGKFKPSRAAVTKTVRAKGKRVKGKRSGRDPLDRFVDAGAQALDLKLEPMEGRGQNQSRSDARARGPVRGFPAAGRRRAGARLLGARERDCRCRLRRPHQRGRGRSRGAGADPET